MDFSYLESFLLVSGDAGYSFFAIINPKTTGGFYKLISGGVKTIYLISSTFLDILCVQNTTLKALLMVIKESLTLKLESGFSCY